MPIVTTTVYEDFYGLPKIPRTYSGPPWSQGTPSVLPPYGDDALWSTNNTASSSSSVTFTLDVPADAQNAYVSFAYKVSSENNYDWLTIDLDGNQLYRVSGAGQWLVSDTIALQPGAIAYLTFRYSKDGSVNSNEDKAFVSGIEFSYQQVQVDNTYVNSSDVITVAETNSRVPSVKLNSSDTFILTETRTSYVDTELWANDMAPYSNLSQLIDGIDNSDTRWFHFKSSPSLNGSFKPFPSEPSSQYQVGWWGTKTASAISGGLFGNAIFRYRKPDKSSWIAHAIRITGDVMSGRYPKSMEVKLFRNGQEIYMQYNLVPQPDDPAGTITHYLSQAYEVDAIQIRVAAVNKVSDVVTLVQARHIDEIRRSETATITVSESSTLQMINTVSSSDSLTLIETNSDTIQSSFTKTDSLVLSESNSVKYHGVTQSATDSLDVDAHEALFTNSSLDYSTWVVGKSGSQTGFSQNGDGNSVIEDTDPFGNVVPVWQAANNDTTSDADGGWNTPSFPVDPTKLYRFSVWVKREVLGNGTFYLGTYGYNSAGSSIGVVNLSGTANTNAYFRSSGFTANDENDWMLVVGYVYPHDHTGTSNHPESGIYSLNRGKIIGATTSFKWNALNTRATHRTYLYYSTDPTTVQKWVYPRVEVCDGTELSIEQLLYATDLPKVNASVPVTDTLVLNAADTVSSHDASQASSDTITVSGVDTKVSIDVTQYNNSSDIITVTSSDTISVNNSFVSADTFAVTESTTDSIKNTFSTSDIITISRLESVDATANIASSDVLPLSLSYSESINVDFSKSDELQLNSSDSSFMLEYALNKDDTITVSTTDISSSHTVSVSSSDALTISRLESVDVTSDDVSSDTLYINISEISQIEATVSSTDSLSLAVPGLVATPFTHSSLQHPLSNTDQINDGVREPSYKWLMLEDNILDGTYHPIDTSGENQIGWIGATASDDNGVIPVNVLLNATDWNKGWSLSYNTSITYDAVQPPEGVNAEVIGIIDANGQDGYIYCYGDYAPQEPGEQYTISVYVRTIDPNFRISAYTADNSEVGRVSTNTVTVPGDDAWHRVVFNPIQNALNSKSDSLSFRLYWGAPQGEAQRTYLCGPQMQPGAVAGEFVDGGEVPTIIINRGVDAEPVTKLQFAGDVLKNEYPVDFDILMTGADGALLKTYQIRNNDQPIWSDTFETIQGVSKVIAKVFRINKANTLPKIAEFGTVYSPVSTDSIVVSLSDVVDTHDVSLSSSDAVMLTETNTDSISTSRTKTDTLTVKSAETKTVGVTDSTSDIATLVVAETGNVSNSLSSTDILTISRLESIEVDATVVSSDSILVSEATTVKVDAEISSSDAVGFVAAESVYKTIEFGSSDSFTIISSETDTVKATIVSSDSLLLTSVDSTVEIDVTAKATDSIVIPVEDIKTSLEITQYNYSSDTGALGISESSFMVQSGLNRADTVNINSSDASVYHRVDSGFIDAGTLIATETSKVIASIKSVDDLTLSRYESVEMDASIATSDTLTLKSADLVSEPFKRATEFNELTNLEQINDGVRQPEYKWFMLDKNNLDGSYHPIEPGISQVGWIGATPSDATGTLTTQPTLIWNMGLDGNAISEIQVVGDVLKNEFPVDFDVLVKDMQGDTIYSEQVRGNSSAIWYKNLGGLTNVYRITVTLLKLNTPNVLPKIIELGTVSVLTSSDSITVNESNGIASHNVSQIRTDSINVNITDAVTINASLDSTDNVNVTSIEDVIYQEVSRGLSDKFLITSVDTSSVKATITSADSLVASSSEVAVVNATITSTDSLQISSVENVVSIDLTQEMFRYDSLDMTSIDSSFFVEYALNKVDTVSVSSADARKSLTVSNTLTDDVTLVSSESVTVNSKVTSTDTLTVTESSTDSVNATVSKTDVLTLVIPGLVTEPFKRADEVHPLSMLEQINDGYREPEYKWLLLDSNKLDGSYHPIQPGLSQVGWMGITPSNADGTLSTQPTIIWNLGLEDISISEIQVAGDVLKDEYPVDFDIVVVNPEGTVVLSEQVRNNTSAIWYKDLNGLSNMYRITVTLLKLNKPGILPKIIELGTVKRLSSLDAINITQQESMTSLTASINKADTLQLTGSESKSISASLSKADTFGVTVTESKTVNVSLTKSDELLTIGYDTKDTTASASSVDSLPVTTSYVEEITASLLNLDAVNVLSAESVSIIANLVKQDFAPINITDTSFMLFYALNKNDNIKIVISDNYRVVKASVYANDSLRPLFNETKHTTNYLYSADILLLNRDPEFELLLAHGAMDSFSINVTEVKNMTNVHTRMDESVRKVYGKVEITYTDPFSDETLLASASGTANGTSANQVANNMQDTLYKWFSLHNNKLDGTFHPLAAESTELVSVGWWSNKLSAADGTYAIPPVLTIEFEPRSIYELKAIGDSVLNEFPVDFDIKLYDEAGTLLYTRTERANAIYDWHMELAEPVMNVAKMTLTIHKLNKGNTAAKITEFYTAIKQTYLDDELVSISLLEEQMMAESTIPIGNVSSNEIEIRLDNANRMFDPMNYSSPLQSLLRKNRQIKAWLGTEIIEGEIEWHPLGKFWSLEWNAPTTQTWASVVGRDRLEILRLTEYNNNRVVVNGNLYDAAVAVFTDAGLRSDEYQVDVALKNKVVPYLWFGKVSHKEALAIIAGAALGRCYCNRDGKVVVETYAPASNAAYVFTNEDSIYEADFPVAWNEMANEVEVIYTPRHIGPEEEVYSAEYSLTLSPGQTYVESFVTDQDPLYDVKSITITTPDNAIEVISYNYYSWGVSVVFKNTSNLGTRTSTNISIVGRKLLANGTFFRAVEDAKSIRDNGRQKFQLAHPFIQDKDVAYNIASTLLSTYKDPRHKATLSARGNIGLRLGDRVTIPDYQNRYQADHLLIRQELNWEGYLESRIEAQKLGGN